MSQTKPKVTVVLTSFNHAKYLREAIDSVLVQTFTNFELIIWDDASTDNSWEIIQSYGDSRIRSFRNDAQRRGIYGINKAISEIAQGEYIAIHHSDDVWELEKLAKQVAYLDSHSDIGAVFTNALTIGEEGKPFTDEAHFYFKIFDQPNRTRHEWLRFFFGKGNALCHPSVLIRKQCYIDCGPYRYGLAQVGDFDMWIRLAFKYDIHVLPDKLVQFRVRDNEANTSGNRPETRARGLYEYSLLLNHYRQLDTLEDLFKVFPEAQKYCRVSKPNLRYALAMAILEIRPYYFAIQFALNMLFEVINDPESSHDLEFDPKDFIKLTGELDPLQVQHVELLTQAVTERDEAVAQLQVALDGEQQARVSERAEAVAQIQALTEWATSADSYAKSKVEEVAQLQVALDGEQQARVSERAEAVAQIQALTEWATSADSYAKSKVEEVAQLQVALDGEQQARLDEQNISRSRIAALHKALLEYRNSWVFKVLPHPAAGLEIKEVNDEDCRK